jgi:hypothetical protein
VYNNIKVKVLIQGGINMGNTLINLEEVKENLNNLYYKSSSIDSIIENRKLLKNALEMLENSIKSMQIPKVNCSAKECVYCQNGKCTAKEITMEDVEQDDNIKFLDEDYMACKTLKHIEH